MQAKKKSEFLVKRQAFSQDLGKQEIYDVIDHWPLYVGTGTLARTVEILDIFRSVLDVEGDIAEFGSHKGANLMYLAKLCQVHGLKKQLHCFDSFEGLTNFAAQDGMQDGMHGKYKGSLDLLTSAIELFGYGNAIKIHQGYIEQTLPAFLKTNPDRKFSLIYYDADLYEPCRVMLSLLQENLSVGGVFVFDEYGHEDWPGETRAVDEFLGTTDRFTREHPKFTRRPGLTLRKIK